MSETLLEKEIREQPEALARTIESCSSSIASLCSEVGRREVIYVLIAGRGTSDNAGVYAKYVFPAFNGLPVAMSTPSLYTFYGRPPRLKNALVLGISQSGQSPDIIEVISDARRQGALTAAITADASSPIAEAAEHTLLLATGPEKAVAATKTFTASLAIVAAFSAALAGDESRLRQLGELPRRCEEVVELNAPLMAARAERYRYMERCAVISRGFSYAIAMEIALKIKEITYVTAEPYSSADFLHGPMAIVEPGFPIILIAPSGTLLPHMREFCVLLGERRPEMIVISDSEDMLGQARTPLPIPLGAQEWLFPVLAVIPGQLLSLHLALARGLDPDSPRGLTKVTETL